MSPTVLQLLYKSRQLDKTGESCTGIYVPNPSEVLCSGTNAERIFPTARRRRPVEGDHGRKTFRIPVS